MHLPYFQRKMDNIFNKYNFILVYKDDILIFSPDKNSHIDHLYIALEEFINNGIIISKKKMVLNKPHIEFLGMELGDGKIRLQPHIVKKILEYPNKLEDTKQLQSFLGILNYARMYIPNLSKIIGPIYSKTTPTGQKYFNQQDIALVRKIKDICRNLPDLQLPLESEYIVVETDASQLG